MVAARKNRRKPKPRRRAAAPAEETVTVKIGHAGPLTGGIAHLGKDDENGVHLAVDEATATEDQDRRQGHQVRDDERGRPGRPEDGPDDRAEVRRRQGRRRGRPPELRRVDSRLGRLQPGRHPDDLRLGDEPEAHRAGLQGRVPHRRPRRPARPRGRRVRGERAQGQEGRDRRRRDRLRRRPRQRSREDAEGRRRASRRPREDQRQGDRLQGDPDQDEGQEPRRDLLRRHGRHRRPDAQAGARARHQGGVRVRRRRVHERNDASSPAPRRKA